MRRLIFGLLCCALLTLLQVSAARSEHNHAASSASSAVISILERPLLDGGWRHGDPGAPVTVQFFFSYDCLECAAVDAALRSPQISNEYFAGGHAQLLLYPQATPDDGGAALLAGCARDQNLFWSIHQSFFQHQQHWLAADNPQAVLESIASAEQLGPCGAAQPGLTAPTGPLPLVLVNGTRVIWTGDPLRDLEATLGDVCQL